jgi:hypothetical protein
MGYSSGDPNPNWVLNVKSRPPTTDPNGLPIVGFVEAMI